jgi:hypothetical protein
MLEVAGLGVEALHEKCIGFGIVEDEFMSVHAEKDIGSKKGDTLVSIHEGMVHEQRLEQGRSHFHQVGVVSGLRTIQRTLQQARIANTIGSAEAFYETLVNGDHLVGAGKVNLHVAIWPGCGRARRVRSWNLPGVASPQVEHGADAGSR